MHYIFDLLSKLHLKCLHITAGYRIKIYYNPHIKRYSTKVYIMPPGIGEWYTKYNKVTQQPYLISCMETIMFKLTVHTVGIKDPLGNSPFYQ